MTRTTLAVRFPTGAYNASGKLGAPEWPPTPARLLTAILATAYESGRDDLVALARALFELEPPEMLVPPAGTRHQQWVRWLPVAVEITDTLSVRKGVETRTMKLAAGDVKRAAKVAEPGSLVDPQTPVYFKFTGLVAYPLLGELLALVPYLGRPTSPAMVSVEDAAALEDGWSVWEPASESTRNQLSVGSPRALQNLDRRWGMVLRSGYSQFQPDGLRRTRIGYTVATVGPVGLEVELPAQKEVEAFAAAALVRWPTSKLDEDGVLELAGLLGTCTPVVTTIRGKETLTALLAPANGAHAALPVATTGGVAVISPTGTMGWSDYAAVKNTLAKARLWTTTLPVPLAAVEQELTDMATVNGARVEEATAHSFPRIPGHPWVEGRTDISHITVAFSQAVVGPLTLGGCQLMAASLEDQSISP